MSGIDKEHWNQEIEEIKLHRLGEVAECSFELTPTHNGRVDCKANSSLRSTALFNDGLYRTRTKGDRQVHAHDVSALKHRRLTQFSAV